MTKSIKLFLLVVLGLWATSTRATDRATIVQYAASLKGLKKAELKTALYSIMKNKKVLSYGSGDGATWSGFWYTDRIAATNECFNRYSDVKFYFPTPYNNNAISGMNIEHSFPKSWWGGSQNEAYKDLYNLYPSDSQANSDKQNFPMGKVTTVRTSAGEGYDKVGTGDAGGKTIQLWEPGDRFKGEFSRSYMYMATTYQDLTWQGTQGLQQMQNNTWPTLQPWAYSLYLTWVRNDRVDDVEVARNDAVSALQGNRNLFIDFPYLCEYVWGDSIDVAFNPETSITTGYDDDRYLAQSQPAVAKPVISPASGTYMEPQTVTITCITEGATIYYSLDGSVPSETSNVYTGAITIDGDATLRAVAIKGDDRSEVAVANYYILSESGNYLFKRITTAPTSGKRYLIVADTGSKLLAAKVVTLSTGKNYGYLYTSSVTATNDVIALASDEMFYTFEGATGGFKLVDSKGQYLYQDGTYNTFTPTTDASKADIWSVTPNSDGTFVIKASDSGNFIQYSTNYTSFGNYAKEQSGGIYPSLWELQTSSTGISTVEAGSAATGVIYNLQGQPVGTSAESLPRGIYIRGGKKFVK